MIVDRIDSSIALSDHEVTVLRQGGPVPSGLLAPLGAERRTFSSFREAIEDAARELFAVTRCPVVLYHEDQGEIGVYDGARLAIDALQSEADAP